MKKLMSLEKGSIIVIENYIAKPKLIEKLGKIPKDTTLTAQTQDFSLYLLRNDNYNLSLPEEIDLNIQIDN